MLGVEVGMLLQYNGGLAWFADGCSYVFPSALSTSSALKAKGQQS